MANGIFIRFRNHRLNYSKMDMIDLGEKVGFSALKVFREICMMTDPETLEWGSTKENRERIAKVLEVTPSRVSQGITRLIKEEMIEPTSLRGLYRINENKMHIVLK